MVNGTVPDGCVTGAVVGNGGILNGSRMGHEINAHDYVFRSLQQAMTPSPLVRASVATIVGLTIIPWLITDPHWRNVLLGFVGLYVLYVMTERDEMLTPGKKAVLITGCDTGFGHGMAIYFDRQGFRVFAGCLVSEGEGAKTLQATCSEDLKVLQLDVTKDEEVEDALKVVKEELGDGGLWGVVNNAGILQFAEVELTPMQVFQRHVDVNCFGQVRVVKAFLPLIKRSKGRIVSVASIAACMPVPMYGAYCMSKASVAMFSDVLRLEMIKWGVKVSIIAPAGFNTNMTEFGAGQQKYMDEIKDSLSKSQKEYFTDTYFKTVLERGRATTSNKLLKDNLYSSDYSPIYHAVDHALLSKTPKARYSVGTGSGIYVALMTHFPNWLTDVLLAESTFSNYAKGLEPVANMTFE